MGEEEGSQLPILAAQGPQPLSLGFLIGLGSPRSSSFTTKWLISRKAKLPPRLHCFAAFTGEISSTLCAGTS